ncbi:MAG: nucleotidyl transferase AbiEii/AbiGii toxin family protein, partial [Pseudomonadota bacterium]
MGQAQQLYKQAINKPEILEKVVTNKKLFFHDKNAKYEEACIGTLRLVPKEKLKEELKQDYHNMSEMFFDEYPTFNEIIEKISLLESQINNILQSEID